MRHAITSGLSFQCSNPYTTHQNAYSFVSERAAKGFCQPDQQHYKLAAFVLHLYFPSQQDHLIMLTVQTNISDLWS